MAITKRNEEGKFVPVAELSEGQPYQTERKGPGVVKRQADGSYKEEKLARPGGDYKTPRVGPHIVKRNAGKPVSAEKLKGKKAPQKDNAAKRTVEALKEEQLDTPTKAVKAESKADAPGEPVEPTEPVSPAFDQALYDFIDAMTIAEASEALSKITDIPLLERMGNHARLKGTKGIADDRLDELAE